MEVPLHPRPLTSHDHSINPLPHLLQTPSGLALLEMQGTINVSPPPSQQNSQSEEPQEGQTLETPIGKLVFPHYSGEEGEGAWQKRVYLFVGPYQRLTGEIKKLPKPVAVIRRREVAGEGEGRKDEAEELEIVEIVKWKIIFSSRPEPVGTQEAVAA